MKINENIKNFLIGGSLVSFASYFLNKLSHKNAPKIMAILLHGAPIVFISTLITINSQKVRNNLIKSGIYLSIILTICMGVLYYLATNKFFSLYIDLLITLLLWGIMVYYFINF